MVLTCRLALFLIFGGALCTLTAGEPAATLHSAFEVQQHLFSDAAGSPFDQSSSASTFQQIPLGKKSVGLAAVYSLLLPGMGELYADGFGSGKYFLIAEGVLWLTYIGFEVQGNALRDDARAFAAARAGVTVSGKDDQYFIDIGNFLDINEYNDKKLRDREPSKLYSPATGYSWQWDSDAARANYRDQRVASDNMYNNRKFAVGAVIINHVASAINAARAAISRNKENENSFRDLHFEAEVMGGIAHPNGILLTISKGF
jgi:hypothetical protein